MFFKRKDQVRTISGTVTEVHGYYLLLETEQSCYEIPLSRIQKIGQARNEIHIHLEKGFSNRFEQHLVMEPGQSWSNPYKRRPGTSWKKASYFKMKDCSSKRPTITKKSVTSLHHEKIRLYY